MSMPALTPALVMTSPSSTKRAVEFTWVATILAGADRGVGYSVDTG